MKLMIAPVTNALAADPGGLPGRLCRRLLRATEPGDPQKQQPEKPAKAVTDRAGIGHELGELVEGERDHHAGGEVGGRMSGQGRSGEQHAAVGAGQIHEQREQDRIRNVGQQDRKEDEPEFGHAASAS